MRFLQRLALSQAYSPLWKAPHIIPPFQTPKNREARQRQRHPLASNIVLTHHHHHLLLLLLLHLPQASLSSTLAVTSLTSSSTSLAPSTISLPAPRAWSPLQMQVWLQIPNPFTLNPAPCILYFVDCTVFMQRTMHTSSNIPHPTYTYHIHIPHPTYHIQHTTYHTLHATWQKVLNAKMALDPKR
jgi:hypothetical protein